MKRFFWKLRDGFGRFMYGRNGNDKLCFVILCCYLTLWCASVILTAFGLDKVTSVIWCVETLLIFYWMFRVFSKNVTARRREVDRFFGYFRQWKCRYRDRKTHVYRKCVHCKALLRLPKKKGKHTVCCPVCKERFSLKI